MKNFISTMLVVICAASGCGPSQEESGSLTQAANTQARHTISPWGVPENVIYFGRIRVTDHRFDPPRVTEEFSPAITRYNQNDGYNHLIVNYTDGNAWTGAAGSVTIRLEGLGCLTNTATYGGADMGQLRWQRCEQQISGSIAAQRQIFFAAPNASGAVKIVSNLQYALNVSNAKPECVERNGTDVIRRDCNGLHNWLFTRRNGGA